MSRQNQWLFETPLAQVSAESDRMSAQLRGRPRANSRVERVRMYHYSPLILRDAIKPFAKWTDISFGGRSVQDVARITGLQVDKIRYRYELILPRSLRDQYFRNIATKMVPGLPAANEYVSQIAIPISWMEKVTEMIPR
jgi:hypothetical protein